MTSLRVVTAHRRNFLLAVQLFQQFIRPPQVGDHDGTSHDHGDVERLFLLGAGNAQAVGLDGVIENAVVTAQDRRGNEPHEFFGLGRERAFEIGIVVDVIEALDEEIVGLVDIGVEPGAGVEEAAGDFALVGDLLLGKKIRRLFALRALGRGVF